jgi:hypothetical protein
MVLKMLSRDEASVKNQESILTMLKSAIEPRDKLLKEALEKKEDETH